MTAGKKEKSKIVLDLDLIPKTCFFSNVRSEVSRAEWDTIRHQAYANAWGACEICKAIPKQSLHAHEVWLFDETSKTQKLISIIALCPACHEVKHFGLAGIKGRSDQALSHFMKINKMKKQESLDYIAKQFEIWDKRSQINWKLDISYLENFNIDIKKFNE